MEYTRPRKLTREFKLEAVRQTALSDKPKVQLARELGVRATGVPVRQRAPSGSSLGGILRN